MKTFNFLKRWERPECYIGAEWPQWFVVYGRHRDSDLLTESNFDYIRKELDKLPEIEVSDDDAGSIDSVQIIRESHWAVGWVEWIGIHASNVAALERAEQILQDRENYPILDEDDFSRREQEEYYRSWEDYGAQDFIKELVKTFRLCDSTEAFLEALDKFELIELYEKGLPHGEFYIVDSGGLSLHCDSSVEKLERPAVAKFLKEKHKAAKTPKN